MLILFIEEFHSTYENNGVKNKDPLHVLPMMDIQEYLQQVWLLYMLNGGRSWLYWLIKDVMEISNFWWIEFEDKN